MRPGGHRAFYNARRTTLNITPAGMRPAGYSPSVRLFEADACGTPIGSDSWPGLEDIFEPGREILVARSPDESVSFLRDIPGEELAAAGERARARVLASHTAARRACELESYAREALAGKPCPAAS